MELEKYGLTGTDAVHIACAEKAKTDFFVTCDKNLIKKLVTTPLPISAQSRFR
jgi:predicted nucleic acid-binding protein